MLQSATPAKIPLPFAANAAGPFIRQIPLASQIGINNGAASFNDGFVPSNFTQIAAGGVPPFGQDMNGLLKQVTAGLQWLQAGGPIFYDPTFATEIGGYPKDATLASAISPGSVWVSTADNNLTDPDSVSAANWVPHPGLIASGTPVPSFSSTVPTGFVAANTLTIGNASSNATGRANGDSLLAYRAIWTQFSNAACPIFTSAGGATTRGANPDADFAANKALSTPDGRGMGFIGVDTMGGPASTRLAGVPVTSGNTTTPGSVLGENLHPLTSGENGPHSHANTLSNPTHTHTHNAQLASNGSDGGGGAGALPLNSPATINSATQNTTITNVNSGSGTGHNTVHLCLGVYWNIKL